MGFWGKASLACILNSLRPSAPNSWHCIKATKEVQVKTLPLYRVRIHCHSTATCSTHMNMMKHNIVTNTAASCSTSTSTWKSVKEPIIQADKACSMKLSLPNLITHTRWKLWRSDILHYIAQTAWQNT